jgi:hypothetical protein
MPTKRAIQRARADKREGKSPTTQAGEFVHEEIRKIRRGEHGARSPEQAIAIGLSEARRAGVEVPPPRGRRASSRTRATTKRKASTESSSKRARASLKALKREPTSTVSHGALSRHAKRAARARRR